MFARSTHPPLLARAVILAVLVGLCAPADPGLAAETFKAVPTLSLRETYDSNVNFNGKGDVVHSAAPGIRVDMQKERMRGWVQARGTAYKHTSLSEYDRIDQSYDAGLEVNATETVTVNLKGNIIADHAFAAALDETGERARRASRQVLSAQPSVTFLLGELNSLTLFYGFTKTDYDTQDYVDSLSNSFGGLWGHRWNERTQLLLQLSGARTETRTARQDMVSSMLGLEYALIETLKARLLAGVGSMSSTGGQTEKRTATNFTADTSLEWRLEKLTTSVGYSRDMTMGISGEDLVRDKLNLNLLLSATERLQLQLNGNMVLSESISSTQASQRNRWIEFRPSVIYRLGEDSRLTLGYSYGASKNETRDELKNRNQVYLDFSIAFP